jgi:hypothetical protein
MQKPAITEPFLSTDNPIRAKNVPKSWAIEKYLNNTFSNHVGREEFIEDVINNGFKEGTAWVRPYWTRNTRTKEDTYNMTLPEILAYAEDPKDLRDNGDGTYSATYTEEQLIANHGNVRVCRNENCFPDPTARREDEMKFFAERRHVTYYDLVKYGFFPEEKLNRLKAAMLDSHNVNSFNDSSLNNKREADDKSYGIDYSKNSDNLNRQKVKLIEYFGYYDLNGNGEIPVVAYWVEDHDINLIVEESFYPSGNIPYFRYNYSRRTFSLWGDSVAFLVGSNQNVKNGLVRGILDNIALANNGQKFVLNNGIDFQNFMRLKRRERYIMVNKPDAIQDGNFNNIPSSTFNTLQMVSQETADMTGTEGTSQLAQLGNDASDQGGKLSLSELRINSSVRGIAALISKVCKEWLYMAEEFLGDEDIAELYADEEEIDADLDIFRNSPKANIMLTVATDSSKMLRLHQMNMLMQQSSVLENNIPEDYYRSLVAEMMFNLNMQDKATKLLNYKPEPSETELRMQEIQIAMAEAELDELKGKAAKAWAEAQSTIAGIGNDQIKTEGDYIYKQAQAEEKLSKSESHQVSSILKPSEVSNNSLRQKQ